MYLECTRTVFMCVCVWCAINIYIYAYVNQFYGNLREDTLDR